MQEFRLNRLTVSGTLAADRSALDPYAASPQMMERVSLTKRYSVTMLRGYLRWLRNP